MWQAKRHLQPEPQQTVEFVLRLERQSKSAVLALASQEYKHTKNYLAILSQVALLKNGSLTRQYVSGPQVVSQPDHGLPLHRWRVRGSFLENRQAAAGERFVDLFKL